MCTATHPPSVAPGYYTRTGPTAPCMMVARGDSGKLGSWWMPQRSRGIAAYAALCSHEDSKIGCAVGDDIGKDFAWHFSTHGPHAEDGGDKFLVGQGSSPLLQQLFARTVVLRHVLDGFHGCERNPSSVLPLSRHHVQIQALEGTSGQPKRRNPDPLAEPRFRVRPKTCIPLKWRNARRRRNRPFLERWDPESRHFVGMPVGILVCSQQKHHSRDSMSRDLSRERILAMSIPPLVTLCREICRDHGYRISYAVDELAPTFRNNPNSRNRFK